MADKERTNEKPKSSRISSIGLLTNPTTPSRKSKAGSAKPASKKNVVKKELTDTPSHKHSASVESDTESMEFAEIEPEIEQAKTVLKPILKNSTKKFSTEEQQETKIDVEENISKDYVLIAEEEGEEPMELPIEQDGTLLQSTLQAQFPGSCGLKYRNQETNVVRGVRLNEERFCPPSSDDGWGSQLYFCVFPKETKRKSDYTLENSSAKTKRIEPKCTDLIVLGLTFNTTEDMLREHFKEFGDVAMTEIKKNLDSGKSKGFGFVRFSDIETQKRVLTTPHTIDGKLCEVKIPNSKQGSLSHLSSKIFVGRCTENMTAEDLREYFSQFGEITDVFIPKPFRSFGFVTFLDPDVTQSLCGREHDIKGNSVFVSNAAPKTPKMRNGNNGRNNFNNFGSNNQNNGFGNNMNGGGGNDWGNFSNSSMMGMAAINNLFGGGSSNSGYNNPQQNGVWNNQNVGNSDMPNLQALGINSQAKNSSNQGQNLNNPLGAIVAAALSQLVGNLPKQSQNQLKI